MEHQRLSPRSRARCLRNGKAAREFTARMSKPKRIQRSRAKGWKMPANAIYVGRPTVWGNPYVVGSELMNGERSRAGKALELYEQHLADNFNERDIRHCLHDKDLACWCALDEPCHACRSYHFAVAEWRPKKTESRAHENDNSPWLESVRTLD